jgi:acyl phosphate:glycerol-3-phosphate acyltransferase
MQTVKIIIAFVVPYFLGGLSVSILLSRKVYGKDVRSCGSGNAGATNMARVFGLKMGIVTLLFDVLKAVASIVLGNLLLGETGLCIAAGACLLGHCFPATHSFKGGKGVSVCAAIIWAIDWRAAAAAYAGFLIAAFVSKRVSLGSITAAVALTAAALCLSVGTPKLILAVFCSAVVIIRHRENIARLIKGTEPAFKAKK